MGVGAGTLQLLLPLERRVLLKGRKSISSPWRGNEFLALSHGHWAHGASGTPHSKPSNSAAKWVKAFLGPAACRGLNLSFNSSQGQGAPSPVIHFLLHLDFTAPSRHSGEADMSSSMPWAQCNSPAGLVGSHLRGEEHPAAAKLHILQFQHGLPWTTSTMHILLWKIFATDVKASPSCACSSQARDQHKPSQKLAGKWWV